MNLESYFQNPPLNRGIHATTQTATFVRSQDEVRYQQVAQQKFNDNQFFKDMNDTNKNLYDEYSRRYEIYAKHSESYQRYQAVLPFAKAGSGVIIRQPYGVLGIEGINSYLQNEMSKKTDEWEKFNFATADKLSLTTEQLEQFRRLPPKERAAAIEKHLVKAPIWKKVAQEKWITPSSKALFVNILVQNFGQVLLPHSPTMIDSPRMTDDQYEQKLHNIVDADQTIRGLPLQIQREYNKCIEGINSCKSDLAYIKDQYNNIDPTSKEGHKLTRFLVDMQYSHLTTKEKLEALNRGIYPQHIGERSTLEFLLGCEEAEENVLAFTRPLLKGSQLARELGIKLPRDFEKIPLGAENAFKFLMGVSTGNPMQVIESVLGFVGLFKGSGPDLSAMRHQELVEMLSVIQETQKVIISMIQDLQKQVSELYNLCVEINENIKKLGIFVAQSYLETMTKLGQMHKDLLFEQEILSQVFLNQTNADFNELIELMNGEDYECQMGIFKTHEVAQRFFYEQWERYNNAMNSTFNFFNTNEINALIKYQIVYSADGQAQKQHRYFLENTWGNAYNYYKRLDADEKAQLFSTLFDPVTHISSLEEAASAKTHKGSKASEISVKCQQFLSTLLAHQVVLNLGNQVVNFHRYDPIIKNHQTGQLFSVEELTQDQKMSAPQKRGKKLLDKVLTLTNLAIVQLTLLSGGTLIPKFYTEFFEHLADNTAKMRNPETPQSEKDKWQVHADLLANDSFFARNAILYAIHKKLKIGNQALEKEQKCFEYRMAYNYSIDSTELTKLFPGWEFTPHLDEEGKSQGWLLVCPFFPSSESDKITDKKELTIPLIDPSDLYNGKMNYPLALSKLVELRERVINEILNYEWPEGLQEKSLRALTDGILLSV